MISGFEGSYFLFCISTLLSLKSFYLRRIGTEYCTDGVSKSTGENNMVRIA